MIPRIVGFSGSTRRPSRTRTLIETAGAELSARRPISLEIYDLAQVGAGVGTAQREALPREAAAIVAAIESADGLIVGSPVYKGSYAGLFKHLIDFVDPTALAGTPVLLAATGGGHRHALVVEHELRPLFGFFAALTVPTALYASDQDFREGVVADHALSARIAQAAAELDRALTAAVRHPIPNVA